jgi:hypothetical protein
MQCSRTPGPDRKDEIVVADAVPPDDLLPVLNDRRDDDLARSPVDRFERAVEIAVAPAVCMTTVADLVEVGIERTRRDLVEQRLPDVRLRLVDEDDVEIGLTQRAPELGDEFEPARAPADDDDLRLLRACRRHVHAIIPLPPRATVTAAAGMSSGGTPQ